MPGRIRVGSRGPPRGLRVLCAPVASGRAGVIRRSSPSNGSASYPFEDGFCQTAQIVEGVISHRV